MPKQHPKRHPKPKPAEPCHVLIARHPEVESNVEKRFVGRGESPYTPKGEQQARDLAACIRAWEPDVVRSSPLARTRDAAVRAAEASGVPLQVDPDLTEIDFGDAEGLTYMEAHASGIPMDYFGGPAADGSPFGGGETWKAFAERVERAAMAACEQGKRVAIVTHGGVFRALVTRFLGLPHEAAWRFVIPPGSIAVLTVHDDHGVLEAFGLEPGRCGWE